MGTIDFESSSVKVINAIIKSVEFLKAIKALNDDEYDMVIRSFEESIKEMEREKKNSKKE